MPIFTFYRNPEDNPITGEEIEWEVSWRHEKQDVGPSGEWSYYEYWSELDSVESVDGKPIPEDLYDYFEDELLERI